MEPEELKHNDWASLLTVTLVCVWVYSKYTTSPALDVQTV